MKIFSWTSSVAIAAIGFGIVGVNASTEQSNVEIRDCDQGVSHCARQFKKVITVHEYNTTVANIRWHEVTTELPTTTILSTEVVVERKPNSTQTSGLCEESIFHVVPGTTTVTVELNATTVKTIIPRVTSTITETSTQWEIVTSECLLKGAIPFQTPGPVAGSPLPPAARNDSVPVPQVHFEAAANNTVSTPTGASEQHHENSNSEEKHEGGSDSEDGIDLSGLENLPYHNEHSHSNDEAERF